MDNTNLTTSQAADRLHASLGDTAEYWLRRLRNERQSGRPVRNPVPTLKIASRFGYPGRVLETWIATEMARRVARGHAPVSRVGEVLEAFGAAGSNPATGRRLRCYLTPQVDEASCERFAQLTVSSPLLVFRIDLAQLRELANQFTQLADYLDGGRTHTEAKKVELS